METTHTPKDGQSVLLIDRREAARMLSVSAGTIDNLRTRGELPSIKIGTRRLYAVEDLRQFVADKKMAPA